MCGQIRINRHLSLVNIIYSRKKNVILHLIRDNVLLKRIYDALQVGYVKIILAWAYCL